MSDCSGPLFYKDFAFGYLNGHHALVREDSDIPHKDILCRAELNFEALASRTTGLDPD